MRYYRTNGMQRFFSLFSFAGFEGQENAAPPVYGSASLNKTLLLWLQHLVIPIFYLGVRTQEFMNISGLLPNFSLHLKYQDQAYLSFFLQIRMNNAL